MRISCANMGCDKWIDLAQKYYEYFVVEDEPIFQGSNFMCNKNWTTSEKNYQFPEIILIIFAELNQIWLKYIDNFSIDM